ncbi:MAG: primosomal protein N' [Candidatus Moraniibacteriota bacterium]
MNQPNEKFLIDVIPIVRIPLSRQQFFSYVFDRPLPTGTLVLIPLFQRNIEGIVVEWRPMVEHVGGFQLKKISGVVEENFLTTQQLQLAEKISNYYLTSLGTVLRHFIVKRVQARNVKLETRNLERENKKISLTQEQRATVNLIIAIETGVLRSTLHAQRFLLFGPASSGKTEVYLHSIIKLKEQDQTKQFLILLPELTLAPQAMQRYSAYFPIEEIVLLHSKISKGDLYQGWQKIKSGQAKIIIGTRSALFSPFQNLGLVVVDEQQDMAYKQWDMNPRYDARKCAQFLSELFSCPLILGTSTPLIETYYQTTVDKIKLLELPKLQLPKNDSYRIPATSYQLVDMRKEKWTDYAGKKRPNLSLLSLSLQSEISYALSHKLQTILFVNHQGMSNFSICSSCKTVLRCPKCDSALVYENSGEYKCLHCKYSSGAFPNCSSCKGIEFKNIGIGTQLVEREIKKLFPGANTRRLDGAASKIAGTKDQIFQDFAAKKIDILIGTQMIVKGWDNPNVGLVAIIDGDSLFTTPDFLTDERAYSNIMQAAGRTGRTGAIYPGRVVIQTYHPDKKIYNFITNQDYNSFYQTQIKERKVLNYPPFGKIIKISIKNEDKIKVEKNALVFYKKISKLISPYPEISLTEPSNPLVSKIRTKFIQQMILKVKTDSNQTSLPIELIKLLATLPTDWAIDVDPVSIA